MTLQCGIYEALLRFHIFVGEIASPSERARVDFIPADDALEKIFCNENSAEGMDSDEESDIDRQLDNKTEESK